jgi:hypothetical protein
LKRFCNTFIAIFNTRFSAYPNPCRCIAIMNAENLLLTGAKVTLLLQQRDSEVISD